MMVIQSLTNFIDKRGKHLFYKEVLISLVLLSMPFWFLVYTAVPAVQTIETKYFTISSNHYIDFHVLAWAIAQKFLPVIILFIWYITCYHWWRVVLIIPLAFSLLQLVKALSTDRYIDESEFWPAASISLPIIVFILWISRKINFYNSSTNLAKEIRNEIDSIVNKIKTEKSERILLLIRNYNKLKSKRIRLNNDKYLEELIVIRNKILREVGDSLST